MCVWGGGGVAKRFYFNRHDVYGNEVDRDEVTKRKKEEEREQLVKDNKTLWQVHATRKAH